jgi:hypothetical protein
MEGEYVQLGLLITYIDMQKRIRECGAGDETTVLENFERCQGSAGFVL